MTDVITIDTEKRDERGTNKVRKLREEGQLPGVVYGRDEESIPVKINYREFEKAYNQISRLYELDFEENGETETVKLKELQWDHLGENVLHVDFERISMNESIEIRVPLVTTGTSSIIEGRGAYLQQHLHSLPVSCLPSEVPEQIPVSIEGVEIGDTIHVEDLELPSGVESAVPSDRLIISVHEAREMLEEEEEEMELAPTALEPELVGEEEEELEEGEEEALPEEEEEEAQAPAGEEE